jgi:uncharacterized protein DUF2848
MPGPTIGRAVPPRILSLTLQAKSNTRRSEVAIEQAVVAGWTGRDPVAVEKHIKELEALGVKRPATTPIFYRVAAARVTTDDVIEVTGEGSGGEVEFVLLQHAGRLWVGTGSDHTDREVEKYGVTVSKQMCEKPIAPVFWAYDDVAPHWDRLILRAYVIEGGERADRPSYRKWRRAARRHADVLRHPCRPRRRAADARVRLRDRRSRARPQDRARLSGANPSRPGITMKRLPEQNPCR